MHLKKFITLNKRVCHKVFTEFNRTDFISHCFILCVSDVRFKNRKFLCNCFVFYIYLHHNNKNKDNNISLIRAIYRRCVVENPDIFLKLFSTL